jgi:thymidine kinase
MEALYNLSEKFGQYKKHVLKVLNIIKDQDSDYYIIIVEELTPLNKHISDLFNYKIEEKTSVEKMLKTLNANFFAKLFYPNPQNLSQLKSYTPRSNEVLFSETTHRL